LFVDDGARKLRIMDERGWESESTNEFPLGRTEERKL
jgi:hypothetical protein